MLLVPLSRKRIEGLDGQESPIVLNDSRHDITERSHQVSENNRRHTEDEEEQRCVEQGSFDRGRLKVQKQLQLFAGLHLTESRQESEDQTRQ